MKKVFSNSSECIHVFAQRSQDEGCSSSRNVFFRGDKIYSYGSHYLLGEFLKDGSIMINDEGYSVTTSKHISQLQGATSHYKQWHTSDCDLDQVYYSITQNASRLARANKPWLYTEPMVRLFAALNKYLETYKIVGVKSKPKYREIKKIVKSIEGDLDGYREVLLKAKKKEEAKALRLAQAKLDDFFAYECKKVKGHKIGYYTVTSINGKLKIGCHDINMDSVRKLGDQLLKERGNERV